MQFVHLYLNCAFGAIRRLSVRLTFNLGVFIFDVKTPKLLGENTSNVKIPKLLAWDNFLV